MSLFPIIASIVSMSGITAVQPEATSEGRVCVAVLEASGLEGDERLRSATRHCRQGDVLDFYDRTHPAISDYNAARLCDLRYPVRHHTMAGVNAAFVCIYNGRVRATVRAAD